MPQKTWAFPAELQPDPGEARFDLDGALESVVMLRAEVPEDAFTADVLGTERIGSGIVIRETGLILTIGYLITEASSIWISTNRGAALEATPIAVDPVTGFGLVQPLGRLSAPVMQIGPGSACHVGENVVVAGWGGRTHALRASIFAMREFAGSWEYLLDEAIFTTPAHPQWGGTAMLGSDGRLLGVGSLLVQEKVDSGTVQGNMFVPIDLLEPIIEDMLSTGQAARPPRPWLGLYSAEVDGQLAVAGFATRGPAAQVGVKLGDVILDVAGERVESLADLLRKVWRVGPAGSEIPMTFVRDGRVRRVKIRSADRQDHLRKPNLH